LRIAWFTPRYHPAIGGAEAFSRAMVRRFVARGDHVDVYTSDADELWYFTDPKRKRLEEPAVSWVDGACVRRLPIRHIPLRRYVTRLMALWPNWKSRAKWAPYMPIVPGLDGIRGDYDLAFGVGFPFTTFSVAAWRTARAAGAPLILTPFLHLSTPGDRVHRDYTRAHQIRLLAEAHLILSPTELEVSAIASWGIPRSRVLRLPMAIERRDITGGERMRMRQALGIGRDARVVGQLGALHPNKGTVDLVHAVARLNDRTSSDEPTHLILAGATSPEWESFAAALAPETGRWLHPIGKLSHAALPDFYAALDLFAMPSRTDSFGIVYLEAWANALPVVAAAAGGVVEVVAHEQTGLLVPFGDVEALTAAVARIFTDRELSRRLGEAGREWVARGFTWDDRFEALLERFDSLAPFVSQTRMARRLISSASDGGRPVKRASNSRRR
jgi:glycosyltransferase involved in cell wall biosynthesis